MHFECIKLEVKLKVFDNPNYLEIYVRREGSFTGILQYNENVNLLKNQKKNTSRGDNQLQRDLNLLYLAFRTLTTQPSEGHTY